MDQQRDLYTTGYTRQRQQKSMAIFTYSCSTPEFYFILSFIFIFIFIFLLLFLSFILLHSSYPHLSLSPFLHSQPNVARLPNTVLHPRTPIYELLIFVLWRRGKGERYSTMLEGSGPRCQGTRVSMIFLINNFRGTQIWILYKYRKVGHVVIFVIPLMLHCI